MNKKKVNFQFFRELVNKTPWETVLTGKAAEQSWQIFKEAFFRVQEQGVASQERKAKIWRG